MISRMIIVGGVIIATISAICPAEEFTFASGSNTFTLTFAPISKTTNPSSGYGIVRYDFSIGVHTVTNAQWDAFVASSGLGDIHVSSVNSMWKGASQPVNRLTWIDAARFVNWLNTSKGYPPAYKFTGEPGTPDFAPSVWGPDESAQGHPYRHKDAVFVIPSEDEWVKAAYWNGTSRQTYATADNTTPTTVDSRYNASNPWNIALGSQELNGTYDMMGNVRELTDSPHGEDVAAGAHRTLRGGSYLSTSVGQLSAASRWQWLPASTSGDVGLRVAYVKPSNVFGEGEEAFSLNFRIIPGNGNPSWGLGIVKYDYGISARAITNAQWDAFISASGATGIHVASVDSQWKRPNQPVNRLTWYDAARFVNWLNTSNGYQPAYKFTVEPGTSGFAFELWNPEERADGHPYRHKDAVYVIPSEDEWVKAAFFNGQNLQAYSTPDNTLPDQTQTRYEAQEPWDVGSGVMELNGTYDMVGNVREFTDSPHGEDESTGAPRAARGGSYSGTASVLTVNSRWLRSPDGKSADGGFRVAYIIHPNTFGSGEGRFTLDFVPIWKSTNPTDGYGVVNYDYAISKFAITNSQWNAFSVETGFVKDQPSAWVGADVPVNRITWYEAAAFVNWLNSIHGRPEAYRFTGTQGDPDFSMQMWGVSERAPANPYRHKDALYFVPSEDEWVKAAYWNTMSLQLYSTPDDSAPTTLQARYDTGGVWVDGPWNVGSGDMEVNGTFDMAGNVREWLESPYSGEFLNASDSRSVRGGAYHGTTGQLSNLSRWTLAPSASSADVGFRVAMTLGEDDKLVIKPESCTEVFIEPDVSTDVHFEVSRGVVGSVSLRYDIRDYDENHISSGFATVTGEKQITTQVNLPQGFYEIVFVASGEPLGIVSSPTQAAPFDKYFGINSIFAVNARHSRWGVEGIEEGVKVLKRSGITSMREMSHWSQAERVKGDLDNLWTYRYTDDIYDIALNYGVEVLEFQTHFPEWSYRGPQRDGDLVNMPTELFTIEDSIVTMAERWQDHRCAYQVLNESNHKSFPADEAGAVTKFFSWLLQAMGIATPVIGGGYAPYTRDYEMVRVTCENGLLDVIDAFAFHRYGAQHMAQGDVEYYRSVMTQYPRGNMPLWVSEMGLYWPRGPYRPTPQQAKTTAFDIITKVVEFKATGVERVFPFCLDFFEEGDRNYGMLDLYRSPIHQMGAYVNAIRMLSNAEYVGDLSGSVSGVISARVFQKGSNAIIVINTGTLDPTLVNLPMFVSAGSASSIDGRVLSVSTSWYRDQFVVTGGIAYLQRGLSGLSLDTSTTAMSLKQIADTWNNTPRQTSPVIFHYRAGNVERGYNQYNCLPEVVEILLWNFSNSPQQVEPVLNAPAGVVVTAGPQVPVTIPPRSRVSIFWNLNWSNRLASNRYDVFVTDNANIASQMLMVFSEEQ